jgi:tetratricopeptide (TPR) repeat protein
MYTADRSDPREKIMRIRSHVTCAIALAASVAATPAAAQRTYDDVIALQDRAFAALQTNPDKALADFKESLTIAQTLGRPRLLAVLFMRLGELLDAHGEIQNTVVAYETGLKALAEDRQLDVRRAIDSLTGTSKSFHAGRAPAPSDLYTPSLARDLGQAERDPALPASLLIAIGNAYMRQPQLDPALNAYNQALQRPEIQNAPVLHAYALANSGEVLRRQGKIDEAERALTTALDLLRQHAPALERRRALALLAAIHRDRGRTGQSLAEYQEALTLYQQAQDPRGEGRALAGLGLIHLQARRFAEASAAYRQAIDRGERVQDTDSLWLSYLGLGQAQRATGDLAGAAASLEHSLSLIEQRRFDLRTDEGKVTLLDSAQDAFDLLIGVHLDRAAADPAAYGAALAVAERARAGAMYDLFGSAGRRALNCAPSQLSLPPLPPPGVPLPPPGAQSAVACHRVRAPVHASRLRARRRDHPRSTWRRRRWAHDRARSSPSCGA